MNHSSFDPGRMMYCYMVDKWKMPTASKMSALAYRTYNHVMEHLGVFHMPTFRLNVSTSISPSLFGSGIAGNIDTMTILIFASLITFSPLIH